MTPLQFTHAALSNTDAREKTEVIRKWLLDPMMLCTQTTVLLSSISKFGKVLAIILPLIREIFLINKYSSDYILYIVEK